MVVAVGCAEKVGEVDLSATTEAREGHGQACEEVAQPHSGATGTQSTDGIESDCEWINLSKH